MWGSFAASAVVSAVGRVMIELSGELLLECKVCDRSVDTCVEVWWPLLNAYASLSEEFVAVDSWVCVEVDDVVGCYCVVVDVR